MTSSPRQTIVIRLPEWVPVAARHYLIHTESGISIRALARANDVHASTILRQVRRFENRRDDPLVDDALRQLSQQVPQQGGLMLAENSMTHVDLELDPEKVPEHLSEVRISRDATRVLRRLCESGAVLAVARDMELAVVARDNGDGGSTRTATVSREVAQVMALRDWIACQDPGSRIARYHITATGRAELKKLLAGAENRAQGLGDPQGDCGDLRFDEDDGDSRPQRYSLTESPLAGLARRRDRDGKPFLTKEQVGAGERLREDFELAQIGQRLTQNWESLLTGPLPRRAGGEPARGSAAARERVMLALHDLGPGLGDVVLRCCCYLEGLETVEKRLGWAARSGKIVLRIALLRLVQHYQVTQGKYGPLIG